MSATTGNASRDIVYCHQCRNEWYRDEHGLACPECQSDFTEIIEPQHDPRHETNVDGDTSESQYGMAEDPEEEDIGSIGWEHHRPHGEEIDLDSRHRGATYSHQPEGQSSSSGLFGFIGSILPSLLGGGQSQYGNEGSSTGHSHARSTGNSPAGVFGDVLPHPESSRQGPNVRHWQGPGYNITVTTSSSQPNLFPRDAYNPQPFEHQPHNIEQIMQQMLSNIGVTTTPHQRMLSRSSPQQPFDVSGAPPGFPFGNIFQLLGVPFGLADSHGDAVFSQEALDRIITQLMEQHQTGNAPGPASAEAIAALPSRRIERKDLDDNGHADCSICMDGVELGTMVTELPCHHWFHYDCVKAWLVEHDTCPHCRQGITSKTGADAGSSQQAREQSGSEAQM